jgi:hypothetical protein
MINPYVLVHETTSELEAHDLVDLVICRCRKHQYSACQEGGFVTHFPLNVLMVRSSALTVATDGKHLTYGGFTPGQTIHFESLELITNGFGSLSLSRTGNDSGTVFVGMTHNGLPTL